MYVLLFFLLVGKEFISSQFSEILPTRESKMKKKVKMKKKKQLTRQCSQKIQFVK